MQPQNNYQSPMSSKNMLASSLIVSILFLMSLIGQLINHLALVRILIQHH
jgi:hypothetical protein